MKIIIYFGILLQICLATTILGSEKIKTQHINFKDQVMINSESLMIDKKSQKKISCYSDEKNVFAFALLKLNKKYNLKMYCENDYLGGVYIERENVVSKNSRIMLAQKVIDGGEAWDTRSWVSRDGDTIRILTITLGSYQKDVDPMSDDKECKLSYQSFIWNPKKLNFDKTEIKLNFNTDNFIPPIAVDKNCLDKNEKWKG